MSAANFQDSHLQYLLRTSRKLSAGVEFLKASCFLVATLLALGLLAIVIDGLVGLQTWGLIATDLFGVFCVLFGLGWVTRQIVRHWLAPHHTARLLEHRLGLRDSRLLNALDLEKSPPEGASPELVKHAIRQGNDFAKEVSLRQAVRLKPLGRAAIVAIAAMLIVVGSVVLMPRLFAAVLPRLLDPAGDNPPFTLVQFDVAVAPSPVYVGRPASITARLGGPETIDRANVVFTGTSSAPPSKQPMLRRPSGEFVLSLDRTESTREFYIDTPRGRSIRYRLNVLPIPTFDSAEIRYAFPAYTGWPESKHVLDNRGIRGLSGTTVTIAITSNVPLKQGTVELVPQELNQLVEQGKVTKLTTQEVTLSPGPDPRQVTGSFPLTFSGHFKITLTGAEGAVSTDHLEGSLTATSDRPPQIEFNEPAPVLLAVEDFKVPVGLSAQDDVALVDVVLQASVNGWGPHQVELQTERPQKNTLRGRYEFDLKSLGATSGDIITYYATARDNSPPAGQTSDTPVYSIQVISQEEYLDLASTLR